MADTQTVTIRPPVWAALLIVLIGGVFFLAGKYVESRDATPATISVSGEGKVNAAPDIAQLTFGVQTGRRATAKEAMASLKEDMDGIIEAVKKAGIEEKDIATEQFYLSPEYDWNEGRQIARGYQVQETLRVKVRDLDKVSEVLGAATAAGANQAGNVAFTIDDTDALQAEAREEAIAKAREKAQALARDLGMRLGKVKMFSEGGGVVPPMPYARMMGAVAEDSAAGVAVPLPAGEQEVTASVTITYELR